MNTNDGDRIKNTNRKNLNWLMILIIISENLEHTLLKQCIKNSLSLNKGNQDHNDVWISDVN